MQHGFRLNRNEEGQSLVFMALVFVGLMAFLGLAIDGGNIYLQRRNVQNAADGAAMAGAVALASNYKLTLTEAALCAQIQEYAAERHLADADLLEITYTGTLAGTKANCASGTPVLGPPAVDGVQVVAGRTFNSFITQLIGQDEFTVRATATARFGTASSVVGLQPIAVNEDLIPEKKNDPSLAFALWDDAKDAQAGRGWVDLDCKYPEKCNKDQNDIKEWMENGYMGAVGEDQNLMLVSGVKISGMKDEYVYPGKVMILPVYDYIRQFTNDSKCNPNSDRYDPGPGEDQCHDNPAYGYEIIDTYTTDSKLVNSHYYHIISFAAFYVTDVKKSGSSKALYGYFIDYVAEGEWGGASDNGVRIIKMTQ